MPYSAGVYGVKLSFLVGVLSSLGACAPASPAADPGAAKVTALGLLMKNEVNATFSRLIVLAFHGDTLDIDEPTLKAELRRSAAVLQRAMARVLAWHEPPTRSPEGREVFYTYAHSVHRATKRLVAAIEDDDDDGTAAQLEQIATTCNNCHHFFRLRLRDSVVPSR